MNNQCGSFFMYAIENFKLQARYSLQSVRSNDLVVHVSPRLTGLAAAAGNISEISVKSTIFGQYHTYELVVNSQELIVN